MSYPQPVDFINIIDSSLSSIHTSWSSWITTDTGVALIRAAHTVSFVFDAHPGNGNLESYEHPCRPHSITWKCSPNSYPRRLKVRRYKALVGTILIHSLPVIKYGRKFSAQGLPANGGTTIVNDYVNTAFCTARCMF